MLRRALSSDEVAAALSRGSCDAPDLPDEHEAECLWKGYVDRLVLGRREGGGEGEDAGTGKVVWADVVDYKTDSVGEDGPSALVEYYRPQLERYRDVVCAQYDLAPDAVRMRLVFLEPGQVVDL